MLVSIVLVSTTLVGADHTEGGRTLRRRDERRACLGFLRWVDLEMGRWDERLVSSCLVFSVGRVDTIAPARVWWGTAVRAGRVRPVPGAGAVSTGAGAVWAHPTCPTPVACPSNGSVMGR
jgi:hypothetical protein